MGPPLSHVLLTQYCPSPSCCLSNCLTHQGLEQCACAHAAKTTEAHASPASNIEGLLSTPMFGKTDDTRQFIFDLQSTAGKLCFSCC